MTTWHIEADDNSPIHGSGNDIAEWLRQWHQDGCPMRVKTAPRLPTREIKYEFKEKVRIQSEPQKEPV